MSLWRHWFNSIQGDQIRQFLPIGLLLDTHYDFFEKMNYSKRNGGMLGHFLSNLHFHINKQFQNIPCSRYYNVSKWFDVDVFKFKIVC
jgi:hypothetical protein